MPKPTKDNRTAARRPRNAKLALLELLVAMGGHLLAVYTDPEQKIPVKYREGGGWMLAPGRRQGVYAPGADPAKVAAMWKAGEWQPAYRPGSLGIAVIDVDDSPGWRVILKRWTPGIIVHESDDGAHLLFARPPGTIAPSCNTRYVDGIKHDVKGDEGYCKLHTVEDIHMTLAFARRVLRGDTVPVMPSRYLIDGQPGSRSRAASSGARTFQHHGAVGERPGSLPPAAKRRTEALTRIRQESRHSATGGRLFGLVRHVARMTRWGGAFNADADTCREALLAVTEPHQIDQVARGFNAGWTDPQPTLHTSLDFPSPSDTCTWTT